MRTFNLNGPCDPRRHYIEPSDRLPGVGAHISRGETLLIKAPPRSGKTTALKALVSRINARGDYAAVYAACERASAFPEHVAAAEKVIWAALDESARYALPRPLHPPFVSAAEGSLLATGLTDWAARCPRPLVIVLDGMERVVGVSRRSILSQLRDGVARRERAPFPRCVLLSGVHDVRDAQTIPLENFTEAQVRALCEQYTAETGQRFVLKAQSELWQRTRGQPWLVNAMARAAVALAEGRVTAEVIADAAYALVLNRDTHLDALDRRLREDRVRRVIEPILAGVVMGPEVLQEDLLYTHNLGLIEVEPVVQIANPTYTEILPRALTQVLQQNIIQEIAWYERADGGLEMSALLEAFQEFYAERGGPWREGSVYKVVTPYLVFMAFLQRLVDGRGRIARAFAADQNNVILRWRGRRYVLTATTLRGPDTIERTRKQLGGTLDRLGDSEGWMLVFDPRPEISWEEKLYDQPLLSPSGKIIHLFGA